MTVRGGILALASTAMLACVGALPLSAVADTVEVVIAEYKYDPAELKIKVGTTVRWTNSEKRVSHSILFTGEGGFESDRFFPGESWERTFDKPGSYPYSCGPHPEMRGLIEVTE
jgi:plastocyanin